MFTAPWTSRLPVTLRSPPRTDLPTTENWAPEGEELPTAKVEVALKEEAVEVASVLRLPLMMSEPPTANFAPGEVVPMPTLVAEEEEAIRMLPEVMAPI